MEQNEVYRQLVNLNKRIITLDNQVILIYLFMGMCATIYLGLRYLF